MPWLYNTLQETNISHLGKRKIIFKHALSGGYVSFLEGTWILSWVYQVFQISCRGCDGSVCHHETWHEKATCSRRLVTSSQKGSDCKGIRIPKWPKHSGQGFSAHFGEDQTWYTSMVILGEFPLNWASSLGSFHIITPDFFVAFLDFYRS